MATLKRKIEAAHRQRRRRRRVEKWWGVQCFPSEKIINLHLTSNCKRKCPNCHSCSHQLPSDDYLSLEDIQRFMELSRKFGNEWKIIALMGGEPVLHPQFSSVLEIVKRGVYGRTQVVLYSGGHTEALKAIREVKPDWVHLRNTKNRGDEIKHSTHRLFTVAPIDTEQYKDADFEKGCWVPPMCGTSYWDGQIFPCNQSIAINRVFGLCGGVKTFEEIFDMKIFKSLLREYCKYCGMFMVNPIEFTKEERISPTWQKALEKRKSGGIM